METSDPEVLEALKPIIDPEVGLSIVDLGLVYRAIKSDRDIEVALTMTTRACPLGEMFLEEARAALEQRFPEARYIRVDLVWDPPWTPAMMSPSAAQQLGNT